MAEVAVDTMSALVVVEVAGLVVAAAVLAVGDATNVNPEELPELLCPADKVSDVTGAASLLDAAAGVADWVVAALVVLDAGAPDDVPAGAAKTPPVDILTLL